jgi:uncharacterized coiled-coil protein SlyX|tara:strand:+ start:130 stop:351 length:222 start_codon:yes stop_codon:yes gene_type:complete
MPTTRHRGIVMTQEQLMKVKIKYLEDRLTTMEKSLSRINNILVEVRFKMRDNKESNDPFIRVMESGEKDYELI